MSTPPPWDEAAAARSTPLARLADRARRLAADPCVAPPELGSVSAKLVENDPFTAQPVDVLWITAAGAGPGDPFASLYLDSLLSLEALSLPAPGPGARSLGDRQLAGKYAHCAFNLNPQVPSPDAALHAFLPGRYVELTQPEAVLAIAATRHPEALAREIYGGEVACLPSPRSGLALALKARDLCAAQPALRGIILGTQGFVTWADEDDACSETTRRLVERAALFLAGKDRGPASLGGRRHGALGEAARRAALAELLPWLRGRLAEPSRRRQIAHVDSSDAALQWVNSQDGARLAAAGAGTLPNHLPRARPKPLCVEWDPRPGDGAEGLRDKLTLGLARYRREYIASYRKHKHEDSPPIRDPNPTVILIPGLGLIAWGASKAAAQTLAQWTLGAMAAARGAEAIDKYQPLAAQEVFDLEYRAPAGPPPPEPELARRVYLVVGAGGGIGAELAARLAREGAHVAGADLELPPAAAGLHGLQVDVTNRASVRAMLEETALHFGGLDGVAITAGLDAGGHLSDEKWRRTYEANVMGAYLVADEAAKLWRDQGLTASFALTTSAQAPRSGSLAFEASKAALHQLIGDLAADLAPLVRVNGVAPAGVVQGSGLFPRERVIALLARHEVAHRESETDEALREKLARFYAERTLVQSPVLPADVAEALFLLLGDRLGKTTGHIIAVDGGGSRR